MNKLNDPDFLVNKKNFPHLMDKCFQLVDQKIVRAAFKTCGIYPWDPSSVEPQRFVGSISSDPSEKITDSINNHDANILVTSFTEDALDGFPVQHEEKGPESFIVDPIRSQDPEELPYRFEELQSNGPVSFSDSGVLIDMTNSQEAKLIDVRHDDTDELLGRFDLENNPSIIEKDHISNFKVAKNFYDVNHPFIAFKKLIGPERTSRYENPEAAKEYRETDLILEKTYLMLKDKFNDDTKQFELAKHQAPKRKYTRKITKKHFVTTSEDFIVQESQKRKVKEEQQTKKKLKVSKTQNVIL